MNPKRSLLLLALTVPFALANAQQPTVEATAVAVRAERLPVLDDDGNVISEDAIQQLMRPPKWQIRRPLVGALVGLVMFTLANQPAGNADCSVYNPCTPREEWRQSGAPLIGLIVGTMLGFATPDGRIDRWRAVEMIREERRNAKAASP